MELNGILSYCLANVINGILTLLILAAGIKLLDKWLPEVNFGNALRDHNLAVAIVIAGIAMALAWVLRP